MKRSEVNYDDLSPMMKQYMDIKKEHEDELLFYRIGDFYELFFEDGITASHELELTLTGKNAGLKERVPMCGVPHHAVKSYLEKAISKGFKVAICEQVEDPKKAKGMVKREVINVVSKGTLVDLDYLNSYENNYLGSILDLSYAYLLTYADISTGDIYSEFISYDDTSLLNRILKLNLKEIIIKSDFNIKLINIFKNTYGINITYNDNFYEEELKFIKDLKDERIIQGVKHLMYYLIVKELKDISHFSKVSVIDNNNYLNLDIHSVRNLELFETLRLKERQYSLIWLLDKCKTSMGSRTLKNWLSSPLKDEQRINQRLDIIEKLNNEFILRSDLLKSLYEVYDLERLCGKVTCGNFNARDALQIKKSLSVLPELSSIISKLGINIKINTHEELYNLLEKSIYEEPPITLKEGYLIKEGYNSELDELKKIRSGGKDFIAGLEQEERERTGIQNLKVGYNKVFGYYIEISKGQATKVKEEFGWERKQTLANGERFISPILKEKEALVLNAEERIIELEYNLFNEIKQTIKDNVLLLKETSSNIGIIDALSSLSVVSEKEKLVRPTFNHNHLIDIKDGFHPVINIVNNGSYVKNDCYMDDKTNTLLITGPNMSGKSTYMRQLAIIIIMAQMGSFVPASSANLPIFDAIYTRIGASDDLVSGESTFMVEMLEAKNAICSSTENSLILFDELGRGTATYDGMSLAEAILEYVTTKIKCKTLFSTHYHELTSLENKYSTIKNIHVSATEDNGKLIFLHKIKNGAVDKSYGVHVAALANMPEEIIKNAENILKVYESDAKNVTISNQLSFDFTEEKKDELREKLKEVDPLNTTPMDALKILFELKQIDK
ncbi:MAG: DNA mismatch repair protein MutS [Bacilli bacterium]|nr:DNA mismatch repair protein MutS [Bacilli bacterium]